jgi:hypothetical protein
MIVHLRSTLRPIKSCSRPNDGRLRAHKGGLLEAVAGRVTTHFGSALADVEPNKNEGRLSDSPLLLMQARS